MPSMHQAVLAKLGEKQGVFAGSSLRFARSSSAKLPASLRSRLEQAYGIPLVESYGATECSNMATAGMPGEEFRPGSVGRPMHDGVVVADDEGNILPPNEPGEICVTGPSVISGYENNPEATAETIVDGWLYTGDVGELDDDGFLKITDRKKDLIVTSSGKNVAPSEIERLLISDPFIDQAVVYGDGRKFISALLVPNFENLAELTEKNGWNSKCDGEFLTEPHVVEFYEQRVRELMQAVSNPERVRKFLLLSRAFQVEADELTATLKVRRRHIIGKFEDQLTALYDD
ncbi:MAG: AMP-binding protein [Planctomycetes bacterium]|nr:AMP-binding protein [Planctomycetota bacterium]